MNVYWTFTRSVTNDSGSEYVLHRSLYLLLVSDQLKGQLSAAAYKYIKLSYYVSSYNVLFSQWRSKGAFDSTSYVIIIIIIIM